MTSAQRIRPESFPPSEGGDWHRIAPEEALGVVGGDAVDGLSEADAADRLARWGPNELSDRGGAGCSP